MRDKETAMDQPMPAAIQEMIAMQKKPGRVSLVAGALRHTVVFNWAERDEIELFSFSCAGAPVLPEVGQQIVLTRFKVEVTDVEKAYELTEDDEPKDFTPGVLEEEDPENTPAVYVIIRVQLVDHPGSREDDVIE